MAPFSFIKFVTDQWTSLPDVEQQDLTGRNVIVTGSNVGLGLEAARHFAKMNPDKLILAVRTVEKGEEAKQDILRTVPNAKVEVWKLDLSRMASVQEFAARVKKDLQRLDIACLNAGIATEQWNTTSDGFETTIETNVICTGLLSVLLLPKLEETANMLAPSGSPNLKPHLTITGSEVHFWTKFKESSDPHPIHALNDKSRFDGKDRYNVSKLLNIYLAREVGALASDKVVVNVVNPGLCHSSLLRDAFGVQYVMITAMKALLARTTEVGSRTIVWAATNDSKKGAYSNACRFEEESDYSLSAQGREGQKKSWADLKEIWVKQAPEIQQIFA